MDTVELGLMTRIERILTTMVICDREANCL